MSGPCETCGRTVPYVVVVERPNGTNALYCPPCASGVPDEFLPEVTVHARDIRRASATRWRS